MKNKNKFLILLMTAFLMVGCTDTENPTTNDTEVSKEEKVIEQKEVTTSVNTEEKVEEQKKETTETQAKTEEEPVTKEDIFTGYKLITVDGGNQSGHREPNVVADIGYGDREYWAFTNEHGQLVRVVAKEIVLQNDDIEPVLSTGRYFSDEAKVPGVESSILDEGHVIADSLGGVSNAYNITPQESTLNRHGDQAYMERSIRDAGGATDFEAIITYATTTTQIPSKYKYTYTLRGNIIVDEFNNASPEQINEALGVTESKQPAPTPAPATTNTGGDVSKVDTNGNGQVTIKEAKEAGFSMPITRDHWLYQYMDDRDGDGMVGE